MSLLATKKKTKRSFIHSIGSSSCHRVLQRLCESVSILFYLTMIKKDSITQCSLGLMDSIRSIQPSGKWKIIVVDSKSSLILNAACKMYDILEENVSFIRMKCTA